MDKKRPVKSLPDEDLKGFEEFIEGQSSDTNFLPRPAGSKKEVSFENFTFLTNDAERLSRLKSLLKEKLPFAAKHEQGEQLLKEQKKEMVQLKKALFEVCDRENSPYRKSLKEIFDSYFSPPGP